MYVWVGVQQNKNMFAFQYDGFFHHDSILFLRKLKDAFLYKKGSTEKINCDPEAFRCTSSFINYIYYFSENKKTLFYIKVLRKK